MLSFTTSICCVIIIVIPELVGERREKERVSLKLNRPGFLQNWYQVSKVVHMMLLDP